MSNDKYLQSLKKKKEKDWSGTLRASFKAQGPLLASAGTCTCVCVCVCVCVFVACTHLYAYTYVCGMFVCIYMCMCSVYSVCLHVY